MNSTAIVGDVPRTEIVNKLNERNGNEGPIDGQ